jgi:DNA-binding winged helix-turn-helix (wHTH) protein
MTRSGCLMVLDLATDYGRSGHLVSVQNTSIYRFGAFELDLRSAELRKNGVKLKLQEQPRLVLVHLLQRPGEVVSRDELRSLLWTDDTFVDFEIGLNTAVKRLRETLGDSANNPKFVGTLPRRVTNSSHRSRYWSEATDTN